MPTKVGITTYKGHKLIVLDAEAKFPFQFGLKKAELIVEHFDAIKKFVAEGQQQAKDSQVVDYQ